MNYYSQFNEDAILDGLLRKIGATNKWCFDVGAGDGIFLSNTRSLIEQGWKGVLVEANKVEFEKLKVNSPDCLCYNEIVSMSNGVDGILEKAGAPHDIDLVNIDIDGQDYHVWRELKKFRPRIVIIEWSPHVSLNYRPNPETDGKNGKNQAGMVAIMKLGQEKGYTPICTTPVNMIFVDDTIQSAKKLENEYGWYTKYEMNNCLT